MAYKVVEFQATPNPDAVKVVVAPSPAPGGPRSYRVSPGVSEDALGAGLMGVPGVRNVLIHDGWISVGKAPDAEWAKVKAGVKRVLESHAEGGA